MPPVLRRSAGFERDEIVDGQLERKLLVHQQLEGSIVQIGEVIGCVHAGLETTELPFTAVGVTRDLEPEPMRFINDRHHFFFGKRGAVDEGAIRLEDAVLVADEVLRRVDLHPIHAVQLRLTHRRTREPRRVWVLALGEAILEPFEERRIRRRRALVERLTNHLHARPEHDAAIDGVAEIDGPIAAARVHVEDGGEPGIQIRFGIRDGDERSCGL